MYDSGCLYIWVLSWYYKEFFNILQLNEIAMKFYATSFKEDSILDEGILT